MRAGELPRPSQTTDIVSATFVVAEPLVHRSEGLRVINSSGGMSVLFHPPSISPPAGGMKGIPSFIISRLWKFLLGWLREGQRGHFCQYKPQWRLTAE